MKFPNNIILDVNTFPVSFVSQYWIYRYLLNFQTNSFNCKSFLDYRFLIYNKENLLLNKLILDKNKSTVIYQNINLKDSTFAFFNLKINKNNIFSKIYKIRNKIKNKDLVSIGKNEDGTNLFFNNKKIKNFFFLFNKTNIPSPSNLTTGFNINFLRKEKIYTKLKYSRVPQYDIVSGGVAALFAGFLGFLVCEKFGFELLDSGDFYYLFMYVVFISFFSRLYLKLINKNNFEWNVFSLKWFFNFYQNLIILLLQFCKIK